MVCQATNNLTGARVTAVLFFLITHTKSFKSQHLGAPINSITNYQGEYRNGVNIPVNHDPHIYPKFTLITDLNNVKN